MIWVIININRRKMGLIRKQILTCLCLLLLIRLQFDTSSSFCKVEATSRSFTKFRSGGDDDHHSGSQHEHHQLINSTSTVHQYKNGSFQEGLINGSNEGDNVFDVDKRRIHTGPNPLHNKR